MIYVVVMQLFAECKKNSRATCSEVYGALMDVLGQENKIHDVEKYFHEYKDHAPHALLHHHLARSIIVACGHSKEALDKLFSCMDVDDFTFLPQKCTATQYIFVEGK